MYEMQPLDLLILEYWSSPFRELNCIVQKSHPRLEVPDEQQLVEKIKSGSESAYRKVFDSFYRQLVICSFQILKDEQLCKDAVQEVFLELWKNRSKLHRGIQLLPYLKRSVINRSINVLKSRQHHMSSGPEPLQLLKGKSRAPDDILQGKEFKEIVMKAIDKMPDRCRAVFLLCKMDGNTHLEVAHLMGISTKTIENQMTKALKILRSELIKYQGKLISCALVFLTSQWGILLSHLLYNK